MRMEFFAKLLYGARRALFGYAVTFERFGSWFDSVGNERVKRDLRRLRAMWAQATRPSRRSPTAIAEIA